MRSPRHSPNWLTRILSVTCPNCNSRAPSRPTCAWKSAQESMSSSTRRTRNERRKRKREGERGRGKGTRVIPGNHSRPLLVLFSFLDEPIPCTQLFPQEDFPHAGQSLSEQVEPAPPGPVPRPRIVLRQPDPPDPVVGRCFHERRRAGGE